MAARHPAEAGDRTDAPPESGKPPELQGWSNARLFHPLSRRLAAMLAPTAVSPNMVSIASGLCVVAAGLAYTQLAWPVSVLAGFAFHLLWHVLDGADGALARLTGRASAVGEMVDGAADYLSHMLIYWLLAVMLAGSIGWIAYPLVLASGLCRIVQANHSESRKRTYLWRMSGTPWLKQALAAEAGPAGPGPLARLSSAIGRAYVALAGSGDARIDAAFADPDRRARARALCREHCRVPLRLQHWLGSNPRTLLLALSMLAGSPLWYFLAELSLFNALLAWSMARQRRCDRELAAALGES